HGHDAELVEADGAVARRRRLGGPRREHAAAVESALLAEREQRLAQGAPPRDARVGARALRVGADLEPPELAAQLAHEALLVEEGGGRRGGGGGGAARPGDLGRRPP